MFIYMEKDYERLLEAASTLLNLKNAAEVGRFLGLEGNPDQIMTNWKNRGIPRARINEISRKIGCHPYWLEFGEGIMEYACAKSYAEVRVVKAMQQMPAENVQTVVKISDSLTEYKKPQTNK